MSHEDLIAALEQVHRELEQTENLDKGDVAQLRQTMSEIESALHQGGLEEPSFSERISDSASSFEESHPILTSTLGRIADMLQQMGI